MSATYSFSKQSQLKIGWALVRVSTKNQAQVQHGSLEQQRHMLERWSSQQSERSGQPYQITRFFEEDVSGRGKSLHKRMALMEIERAIESKAIDFIVFEKVDRLARDMIYNLGLVKKAHEYEVEVHEFESGKIDLRDRGSRLGFNIKNLLAEEYSLDLEEKMAKKQRESRFNNGKDVSTLPVLGLDPHPGKRGMYVINKKEQEIVIDIFKKFVECASIVETSKYCINKGYKTKTRKTKEQTDKLGNIIPPKTIGGHSFATRQVYYLLTNQKIRGYGFFKDTWNQFDKKRDEKGLVRWNYPHGPVVPPELFEEAQIVLEKSKKFDSRTRGTVYFLTGILEHEDGTKFSGAAAGGRNDHYEYYHCKKHKLRIQKDRIESLILKRIKDYMQDSELLNKLIADVKPMADMGKNLIKNEVSKIKARIKENLKVIEGFTNYLRQAALTDVSSLESTLRTIGLERDRAETENQVLERELANKENQLHELNSDKKEKGLKEFLDQVMKNFDKMSDSKKREIIHTIIPKIQILPKNKLKLFVRTDFKSEGQNRESGKDGGERSGYFSGLSKIGKTGVTLGGNFSSRRQMAGSTRIQFPQ